MSPKTVAKQKLARDTAPPGGSETSLMRAVMLRASELGARLFRNQTGKYRLALPSCPTCRQHGRVVASGLVKGGPDLVGWKSVVITPEMVGLRFAMFVAVELKSVGARTDPERLEQQKTFLRAVNEAGGIGRIVDDVADVPGVLF